MARCRKCKRRFDPPDGQPGKVFCSATCYGEWREQRTDAPSPDEIAARAAAIREGWSDDVEQSRLRVDWRRMPAETPAVGIVARQRSIAIEHTAAPDLLGE